MAANQPLTTKHQAVATAVGISFFKRYDEAHILSAVNKLLQDVGEEAITQEELNGLIADLKRAQLIRKDDSNGYWQFLASENARRKRSQKDSHLDDAQRLGSDSYFLIAKELLSKHDTEYIIEYNCDGKGSTQLPTGKIVSENLNKLCTDAHKLKGKPAGTGNGGGADKWMVSLDHHPNAPQQKTKRTWREFLNDKYPI